MERTSLHKSDERISVSEVFHTLQVLTLCRPFTGLDEWRQHVGNAAHNEFDPDLAALLVKQPPSKAGIPTQQSLWTALHFSLALPVLFWTIRQYCEDPKTAVLLLSEERASQGFPAFAPIAAHYAEYQLLTDEIGELSDAAAWRTLLEHSLTLPIHSVDKAVRALPPPLRKAANSAMEGGPRLAGRIVLAYFGEHGVPHDELHIDDRVRHYVEPIGDGPRQSFFERLCAAYAELPQLAPYLGNYDARRGIQLDAFLGLVAWYGRPHVVEMVMPNMTGAASHAARALITLFKELIAEGAPDYMRPLTSEIASVQQFRATQSLRETGRLSLVEDILYNPSHDRHAGGTVVRQLMTRVYSDDERQAAWGNAERYVPDAKRTDFAIFRQDVGNIVYAMSLFGKNGSGSRARKLADAAWRIRSAASENEIRNAVQAVGTAIDDIFTAWGKRFPGHERLRIVQWLRHTFGIVRPLLVSVPFDELVMSFAGSSQSGAHYEVCFREADAKCICRVSLPSFTHPLARVHYRTLSPGEVPRITSEGLPFAAWLTIASAKGVVDVPVVSRGSFEPFGHIGSAHAGEVIGFGCSVHHAALAVMLAELTALGASRTDLRAFVRAAMSMNGDVHKRTDLADFQLEQIFAAVHTGSLLSIAEYVRMRPSVHHVSRPHLQAYAIGGSVATEWAEPAAARLVFAYPDLYDADAASLPHPRASWYDGRDVRLGAGPAVAWRCVYSDEQGTLG